MKQDRNAYAREWNTRNKDKKAAANKRYHDANKESIAAHKALYHVANREKILERTAAYQKANPAKVRYRAAKRRAAKKRATPGWADENKMREFYFAADFLGMVSGEWHHVDHIVPLQSNSVCGFHSHQNMQVLPGKENRRKGNVSWPDKP